MAATGSDASLTGSLPTVLVTPACSVMLVSCKTATRPVRHSVPPANGVEVARDTESRHSPMGYESVP